MRNPTPSPTEAVTRYTGLVKKVVYIWTRRLPAMKSFEEDMIQEGYLGLLQAIKHHRPDKGAFMTCAFPWVTYFVRRYVVQHRGLTSRPVSPGKSKDRGKKAWEADHHAKDFDGEIITSEAVPSNELNPEELCIRKDAVAKANATLKGIAVTIGQTSRKGYKPINAERDVNIFAERLVRPNPGGQGVFHETRAKYGVSRQRVKQIELKVGARFEEWTAKVRKEAA